MAFVYFNPHAIKLKKLAPLSPDDVKKAFGNENIKVFSDSAELFSALKKIKSHNIVFLLMSSGDFDGVDFIKLSEELLSNKKYGITL